MKQNNTGLCLLLEEKRIKMIYLPIRKFTVARRKSWWLCIVVSNNHPQPPTFARVLLINHYTILTLFYTCSTCTCSRLGATTFRHYESKEIVRAEVPNGFVRVLKTLLVFPGFGQLTRALYF